MSIGSGVLMGAISSWMETEIKNYYKPVACGECTKICGGLVGEYCQRKAASALALACDLVAGVQVSIL